MKLDLKGMHSKIWRYFILFTAVVLVSLWLFQIVFLRSFYQSMKTGEIVKSANKIIAAYGGGDFENTVSVVGYNNDLRGFLLDENGVVVTSSEQNLVGPGPLAAGVQVVLSPKEFGALRGELSRGKNGRATYTTHNDRLDSDSLIFGAVLGEADAPFYLYIISPLQPMDSTVAVLRQQLVYVTILALLLGLIASYFISRRLSKPIAKITAGAKKLAGGDYGAVFEKGGYTEINELADTLNYATKELSKVEGLRRDLIANVSHDLRTPLTLIKSYGEMIRDISGNDPKKREEHVGVIIDEADRLTGLVEDILDLSKFQSGSSELRAESFDLSKSVRQVLARFAVLCEKEGYVFETDLGEGMLINADRARIEQVLYNLIGNAVHYTGDDKRVSIKVLRTADGFVRAEISDTGKGIPEDEIKTIWERYYRAGETHRRPAAGTGLGLAIVKELLTAHGARFGADGRPGGGSMFWFEI